MRTVTVRSEQSDYRARIEPATKGLFRKRHGWRYVIERCWSRIGPYLRKAEDWRAHSRGPWVAERSDAEAGADAWLDAAKARNPSDGDYR